MKSYLFFLAGEVATLLVVDLVLMVRVYRVFPNQRRRYWPGIGLWMVWKLVRMHLWARNRLNGIRAASVQFPLGPHHSNVTREFVETIARYASVSAPAKEAK